MRNYGRIIGFVVFMIMCLSLEAPAATFKIGDADWSLGGSARLDASWRITDNGDVPEGEVPKTNNFALSVPVDTNIFAKVVSGKMSAYYELGVRSQNNLVDTRHFYATYDLGSGNSLLFGQTWTCLAEDSPNQKLNDDDTLVGFGDLYALRHPQLRFIHSQDKLTFQVAVEDSKKKIATDLGLADAYVIEGAIPAIVVSLGYDSGKVVITPSLYAQKFTLKSNVINGKDVDAVTYIGALDAAYKAAGFTLSGEAWYGQNVTLACDITNPRNANFGLPVADDQGDIENVKSMGGWLQLAVPVKSGKCSTGVGYQKADVKNIPKEAYESSVSTMGAFINYEYPIEKNFTITPELTYYKYGNAPEKTKAGFAEGANDNGTDVLVGVHFQYDF